VGTRLWRTGIQHRFLFTRLVRAAAAAIVTSATLFGVPLQAHAEPSVGVQFHATWTNYTDSERIAVLDKLAAAGVQWVRIDLGWGSFEGGAKGKLDQWYFQVSDQAIDAANARGIKVLGTFWRTPKWANGGGKATDPPSDPADYADFARCASAHFRGRVSAWEVWNEPNLKYFWSGANPARYAALVRAAYPAFKAGDPDAPVVAGSVSKNDTPWLERMYAAGIAGSFDVLSTHPYQDPPDAAPESADDGRIGNIDHIRAVHDLMSAQGDKAKPIWATEFGWSSSSKHGGVTEERQADYLVRTLKVFADRYPYVTNVFWYNERATDAGDNQNSGYGLLRHDLSEKPAYRALKEALVPGVGSPPPFPPPPVGAGLPPPRDTQDLQSCLREAARQRPAPTAPPGPRWGLGAGVGVGLLLGFVLWRYRARVRASR